MAEEKDNKKKYNNAASERAYGRYEQRKQLQLTDIIYAVRKHLLLIALCTGVGLILGITLSVISYMRGEMSKSYAIKAAIAVTSQNENGLFTTQSNDPNSTDIYLAEDMVDSVIFVMKSDKVLDAATERLNLVGISTKDIYNNLIMEQYNKTQVIEITLYWRSAKEGIEILNAIMEVAPNILVETLKIGNVSVINQPKSQYLIGGSLNASMWVYMAVLGMAFGVGLSILMLLLSPTLLKTSDMERVFGLEILGEIPEEKGFFRKKRNLILTSEDDWSGSDILDNYVSTAHILKNRIKTMEHPCIYVTSAAKNEGKTTVTAYLAVQLAELGMKVLLIDFDTRNPRLGGLFLNKVEYEHSLNALYRGETSSEEAITKLTGNLDILPSVLERKPVPLDDALLDLVSHLHQGYDVLLMDTAPVGQVADTMSLNQLADIALLVVGFDKAGMEEIRDALSRLNKSGMKIMGCVVNSVKDLKKNKNYGYYRGDGYHGGYGTEHRHKEKTERQKEWEEWEKEHSDEK